jgi:amino acid adenylation domain-containing protein
VVKAGGAFLPLNYEHPPARLAHQIGEAAARVVVTEASVSDRMPAVDAPVIVLDRDELEGEPATDPAPVNEPDDLVYVMYTSGSTGTPKGAGVTHRNVVNYTSAILDRLGLAESRGIRFGAVSALSTDLGNTSIFPALLGGGTLHLVSPEDALDGQRFAEYVRSHPLDVLKITPSHLRALIDAVEPAAIMPREWLVLGGEALAWQLVERLRAAGPRCRILNHYGPTETTIGTCTFDLGSAASTGATVPVGSPLPGTRAYVVDRRLQPLPLGVPGELCIGGTGVARGYVNRPDETATSFVPDPFANESGARLYRTGDRVRALRDGNIEFLGRFDDQVKIRGYRVEPGEVERVLATHPGVRQSTVVVRSEGDNDHELVAYVVRSDDASTEELQSFLRESVPAYMVPARFVRMDALPLTPSGKVDRRSLPDPGEVERAVEYVAPRTPLEEELARIWQELLGIERVGVYDDFFALGGHSLLATQAVIRIRNAVADIPLHSLFNAPTVASLAEAILDAELTAAADTPG